MLVPPKGYKATPVQRARYRAASIKRNVDHPQPRAERAHNWNGSNVTDGSKRNRARKAFVLPPTCQIKGCTNKATIRHHIDVDLDNHAISNLVGLCRPCHLKVHGHPAAKGKRDSQQKLTWDDVDDIRAALAQPKYGDYIKLAKQYGVTSRTIRDIYKNRKWVR